jgi:hypothetical protein
MKHLRKCARWTLAMFFIIIVAFLSTIVACSISINSKGPAAKVLIQKEEGIMMIYGEFPKQLKVGEKIIIYKSGDEKWTYCEPSVEFMKDTVVSSWGSTKQEYREAIILEIYDETYVDSLIVDEQSVYN